MRVLIIVSLIAAAVASVVPQPKVDNPDWWQTAIFYQVYPRSFKDSDNNGEGDLRGIINKIDHFVDAGITAIWLSPIYKSPQVDSGYDISDFRDIDPIYGTLADFDELVEKAHERELKVVMDFVPNHSSNKHQWFIDSENEVAGYEDFYIWKDGVVGVPPNNWLSIWGGSAWQWSAKRQQYYLHQFSLQQPDLNYANPAVVTEMTETLVFWMDRGIDGFRIDAIPHLCETGFEDEPVSGDPNATPDEWNFLSHVYTKDQEATYEQIYKWRAVVDEYAVANKRDTIVLMTEAYTTLPMTMKYYGTAEKPGAHFSFNFQLITGADKTSKAAGIVNQVNAWMAAMPTGFVPNWVIGNHDNHRVATRYGEENADGMNMVVMMLPGVAVTYNGEEIGMEDGKVLWDQCQDPSVCPKLEVRRLRSEEDFEELGRDFERTPFHWDASNTNAGFNEGFATWLPVSEKYVTNNLANQKLQAKSHFSVYQLLTKIVRPAVMSYSQCTAETYNEDVVLIRRNTVEDTDYSIILAFNTGDTDYTLNLQDKYNIIEEAVVIAVSGNSDHELLSFVETYEMSLKAHNSVILKVKNGAMATQISLVLLGFAALMKMFL